MLKFHKISPVGSDLTWYEFCLNGIRLGIIKGNQKIGYTAYDIDNNILDKSSKFRILRSVVQTKYGFNEDYCI